MSYFSLFSLFGDTTTKRGYFCAVEYIRCCILNYVRVLFPAAENDPRYATQKNLYKPRVRTNTGKQLISFKATDLWKSIPQNLKDLNVYTFSKNIKNFLLSEQYSKKLVS